ncbi:hypothetical protein BDZ45DRAFT_754108 [Acephala macrosclerotiorum]|nr:hypothetical protein BDZ45DRAFT_754108 [Acephala macrosclerotiorum]
MTVVWRWARKNIKSLPSQVVEEQALNLASILSKRSQSNFPGKIHHRIPTNGFVLSLLLLPSPTLANVTTTISNAASMEPGKDGVYPSLACGWNTALDGSTMVVSADMISSRQMDGFWKNWDSTDLISSSWDWTVDANQCAMMTKAQSRGANYFELFSNSPMWWMTTNHNPSGNNAGGNNNLQAWNYNTNAVYLANLLDISELGIWTSPYFPPFSRLKLDYSSF